MHKTFIAGLTALSLTFTTAGPVQAQGVSEDQLGRILFGLFAAAAVAKIVEGHQADAPTATLVTRPKPKVQDHRDDRAAERARMTLPRQCLRRVETRRGTLRVMAQRCMRRNFDHVRQLPDACHVVRRTNDRRIRGWKVGCLRDAGYRLARRTR